MMWQWLQSVSNKLVCLNLETKTSPQQQCFIITLFCQKLVFFVYYSFCALTYYKFNYIFFLKKRETPV